MLVSVDAFIQRTDRPTGVSKDHLNTPGGLIETAYTDMKVRNKREL